VTENPLLALGPSNEAAGIVALLLGGALLALALVRPALLRRVLTQGSAARFVALCALAALLLSWAYIGYFLRGGPRIIDATSYWLEARALASGQFAFPVPEPTAAFRGRFSLLGPSGLSVIFPPGYPLLLALGFILGAPLFVGPLLAAALVAVTYMAAKELALREEVARLAALLSTLCAVLRYHTADTMSHGLSALLLAGSVAAAARPTGARALLAGALTGWLVATRPMSGAVAFVLVLGLIFERSHGRERSRQWLLASLALAPGIALLLAHQHAATGSIAESSQLAYYALADGPPGCFRWGFGENVGCRFEHGDFVKRRLTGGFGPLDGLWISSERLLWHAFDLANLALLWPLVPWIAWRRRRDSAVRWLALGATLIVLAYLPYYYPGSYPGGGARLIADALPLEHLLLALALVELNASAFVPALAILGFALSTVHSHLALRDREGGRPMFEPDVLRARGVTRGLAFVKSDHGFSLGHDPNARDPKASLIVARGHGDAHDLALWIRLGRPPAVRYQYATTSGATSLEPFHPAPGPWRWELEAEWPPRSVMTGWVHPDFRPCLSAGRGLHLRAPARVALELGAPEPGHYRVALGWLADPHVEAVVLVAGVATRIVHASAGCEVTELGVLELGVINQVEVRAETNLLVDYLELVPGATK
jgi:hypothetical protein